MTIHQSTKGPLCLLGNPPAPIATTSDFLDQVSVWGHSSFVMHRHHFVPEFFDLKTGLAGDILQKVSTYRKRLVILGDFSDLPSKSLRDFIYESNRTGQVVFSANLEDAIKLLADPSDW